MISVEQFQAGLLKFVEQEILPAIPEPGRVLLASGAYLYIKNIGKTIENNTFLRTLGCIDGNQIDIDELYNALEKYYPDKLEINLDDILPAGISKLILPGKQVKMELTKGNIDTLYKLMKG